MLGYKEYLLNEQCNIVLNMKLQAEETRCEVLPAVHPISKLQLVTQEHFNNPILTRRP